MKNRLVYPIYDRPNNLIEKIALKLGGFPIHCNICGSVNFMNITNNNFRENCYCRKCNSFNRQRQIAYLICKKYKVPNLVSLSRNPSLQNLSIYNTETEGPIHKYLSSFPNYVCSEYFGPVNLKGNFVKNKRNEDLANLSFQNDIFDLVITTDVFEHIPNPYHAHQEVYRVLKPKGRHIFTVPFYQTQFLDEKRAYIDENNKTIHIESPIFHIDPLRKEGILVFNIFSIEMVTKLAKIGFQTNTYFLFDPFKGILGNNGIIFEAIKK